MTTASKFKLVILTLTTLFLLISTVTVRADLIFEFSFSDDPSDNNLGNTHVAGTVTGTLFGLVDNAAGQSATSVFIDSHPLIDAGFGPLDVIGIDLVSTAINNTFDVFGGIITDAFFLSNFSATNGGTAQLRLNSQDGQEPGANVLRHRNLVGPNQFATGNRDGLQGITFSNASAVPSPATLALFGLGLAALGWSRRKRA